MPELTDPVLADKELESALRLEGGKKIFEFLHKTNASEVFGDEASRIEYIKSLDPQAFIGMLERVNGMLRDKSKKDRPADGEGVLLDDPTFGFTEVPPDQEDKINIAKELLESLQTLDKSKDIALALAIGINQLHLFADGNGRTSRLAYHLFFKGYNGLEDDYAVFDVLGAEGRQIIDPTPGHLHRPLKKIFDDKVKQELEVARLPDIDGWQDVDTLQFGPGVEPLNQKLFKEMIDRSYGDYARTAILRFMREADRMDEIQEIQDTSHRIALEGGGSKIDDTKTKDVLRLGDFTQSLSNKEVESIIKYYKDVRSQYSRMMIDAIVHADQYPFPDEAGWGDYSNLKEFLLFNMFMKSKEYFDNVHPNK